MEWIILGIALLVMAPAALLPILLSSQETMEADLRSKQPASPPALVHPVQPSSPRPHSIEQRTAA